MYHHDRPDSNPVDQPTIGELNISQLLGRAYQPEAADPEFVHRLQQQLLHVAGEEADRRVPVLLPASSDLRTIRLRLGLTMAVAATLAAVALFLHAWFHPRATRPEVADQRDIRVGPVAGWLTPAPRPQAVAPATLAVGAALQTDRPQRRTLPDGSVLYANRNTSVQLEADRRLNLVKGEVFLEVARPETGQQTFVVQTPNRQVRALGTKFSVRADGPGPQVVVTQGQVECDAKETGPGLRVEAGQQLVANVVARTRTSHLLDWAGDLMAQAEPRLVPASQYGGGALVTVNSAGQQESLSLRRYHIDVHIEDGFARTTIDQTYFNASYGRLEGTFYFPMPPDASLSRLAMYVAQGQEAVLMEGGMAERDFARTVYENIVYRRMDPALLEWVDGSTFKMRVFPLEGRQEKRVILSYTQLLSSLYGRTQYRFPAGHNLNKVREWAFKARVRHGAAYDWSSLTHSLEGSTEAGDLLLKAALRDTPIDKDVELSLLDRNALAENQAQFSTFDHEDSRYFMVRYRPGLPGNMARQRRDWVILFESGADRNPVLARAQIQIVQTLLANAEPDDTFSLVTAGSRTRTFAPKAVAATPDNIRQAVDFLEKTHLVGALDLEKTFAAAGPYLAAGANPCLLHVGSGIPILGQRRADVLVQGLPAAVPYVGIGVGKRWGREFMKLAAERGGGYFTQINPDEPIAWRAFDLLATLNTPRLHNLTVTEPGGPAAFLTFASSVAQGEELCAVTRLPRGSQPVSLMVRGTLGGQSFERALPVENVIDKAGYLPRTWAKLEIDRLLAEDSQKNKDRIVALSKAMYVMTPFTSLLVLENEAMYKQYNVDRGRKDHWAMYPCPAKVPVVTEVEKNPPRTSEPAAKASARDVAQTVLVRSAPAILQWQRDDTANLAWVRSGLHFNAFQALVRLWDLERGDIGLNPDMTLNYNVDRIEEISVPGGISPLEAIGILGSPDGPPMMLPPPAGFGWRGSEQEWGYWGRGLTPANVEMWSATTGLGLRNGDGLYFEANGRFRDFRALRRVKGEDGEAQDADLMYYRNWAVNNAWRSRGGSHSDYYFRVLDDSGSMSVGDFTRGRSNSGNWFGNLGRFYDESDSDFAESIMPISGIKGLYETSARSLIIRGSTRFHTRIDDGILRRPSSIIPSGNPSASRRLEASRHMVHDLPRFSGDNSLFTNLLAYAPGMNSSRADVWAVIEAEAAPLPGSTVGRIEPAAKALVEKARSLGWQTWKLLDQDGKTTFSVTLDGSGRYRYEQTLASGLQETVSCDGQTLLHLYPQIGVGARREVSRFHRGGWSRLVPWVLPPAEDLARGCDLVAVDDHTVALVPAKPDQAGAVRIELSFSADGRVGEWRTYSLPEKKLLARLVIDGGTLTLFGPDGQKVLTRKGELVPAAAPDLRPATAELVVLPLPYRRVADVQRIYNVPLELELMTKNKDAALAYLAAAVAAGDRNMAERVLQIRYPKQAERPVGLYTLLAACGAEAPSQAGPKDLAAEYPNNPLARYLARAFVTPSVSMPARHFMPPGDGLLDRLEAFRILRERWVNPGYATLSAAEKKEERQQALQFIQRNHNGWGWALLVQVSEMIGKDQAALRELAAAWMSFQDVPGLAYAGLYEHARTLYLVGDATGAQKAFLDLHRRALDAGFLPPIDETFAEVLRVGAARPTAWEQLMRDTAKTLVGQKDGSLTIALAVQCDRLGDSQLASEILDMALTTLGDGPDRLVTTLAAVDFLGPKGQYARAGQLVRDLLADSKLADQSPLWRLAAALALGERNADQGIVCLERALELDYRDWGKGIDLARFRQEYTGLLQLYDAQAGRLTTTKDRQDLAARLIRVADRWRSLDDDPSQACELAGKTLRKLGDRELGWAYLSSALAYQPANAPVWDRVAQAAVEQKERRLADDLYARAFEIEGTNPTYLFNRAQNLRQSGRRGEANELLRQIVAGSWHTRFNGTVENARQQLSNR